MYMSTYVHVHVLLQYMYVVCYICLVCIVWFIEVRFLGFFLFFLASVLYTCFSMYLIMEMLGKVR